MHYGASVSEVADCTAATSHSSRATQTRGGCIVSAVLRFCSVCVSDRESGVGASVASHNSCFIGSRLRPRAIFPVMHSHGTLTSI